MVVSTCVYGFRPANDKWEKMKAIYDAYVAADLQVPDSIRNFFSWCEPSEYGVIVRLPTGCLREHRGNDEASIDILLKELPEDMTVIRVVNSWRV